jgi:hypothetical protein
MTRLLKPGNDRAVHHLIAATAKELAAEAYEIIASHSDGFYRANRSQGGFVNRRWREFVAVARSTLIDMLGDAGTSDALKEKIFEAILQDGAMNPPREHAEAVAAEQSRFGTLNAETMH